MNSSIANDSSAFYHEISFFIYITSNTINLILGLPTNVYVLWLTVTGAGGLAASEIFILNLSVSEIIYCLCNLLALISCFISNNFLDNAVIIFNGFIIFGRPFFMSSICVERYLAVVHPVVFLRCKPLRYRVACCGLVWLMVLGLTASLMVSKIRYIILGLYLIMISVKLFCCVSVLRALRRSGPGEGEREREGMNDMKLRAFRIIFVIMMFMLATYLPMILTLILAFYLEHFTYLLSNAISLFIVVATGFVQPLLYLQRAGKLPCIRGF